MKVSTYLFGDVEINPERVIEFPAGLAGFESSRRFALIHESGEEAPNSYTLQSLEDAALAFQIMDPAAMGFSYELALTDAESALLQSPAAEDVTVMLMTYRQSEGGALTAAVRAPLLINTRARLGLQKVMEQVRPNLTLSNLASDV